jgi:outer membrane lipoprotein-sorting protein
VVWKERGWALALLGRETLGATLVHKLKLARGDGRDVFIYIDVANGLELKTATIEHANGAETRMEIVFTDYRPVQGVLRPFKLDTSADGQLKTQLAISSWEINPVIDDAIFRLPEPAAKRP